jgi:hypothetical protein
LATVDPERFFRPLPSGSGVWIGVVLDPAPHSGVDWDEVEAIVKEAFRMKAPRRLVAELGN